MNAIQELVARNASRGGGPGPLPPKPSMKVAVVTCMDARIDVYDLLCLRPGEAHVLRNAGGPVTDDVIRSLAVSQRKLGTREVMLLHHTGCGMATFTDEQFWSELEKDTGLRPPWAVETFSSIEADVRQSIKRVQRSPYLKEETLVRGFVIDTETWKLREVCLP